MFALFSFMMAFFFAAAWGPCSDFQKGAMVLVEASAEVGVLLDDIPEGAARDAVADQLLLESDEFWEMRANWLVRYAYYYSTFRNYFVNDTSDTALPVRGQLPQPPEEKWIIDLDSSGPVRVTRNGHDYVLIAFDYTSVLLSDKKSPGITEPDLAHIGGVREEFLNVPLDPMVLMNKTGLSCIDLFDYPENSVNAENAYLFYDETCDPATTPWCYEEDAGPNYPPTQDCATAVEQNIGSTPLDLRYERVPWSHLVADYFRVDPTPTGAGADLDVREDELSDTRLRYRHFDEDDCALVEQCVGDAGWRRVYEFSGVSHNVGAEDLLIGDVEDLINAETNLYAFSACHGHYHFNNYASYEGQDLATGDEALGHKQGFCIKSTNRLSNNAGTPLNSDYAYCARQGLTKGWADKYQHGLPCQWMDVTDILPTNSFQLRSIANPDDILCEGSPVLDTGGWFTFEPSGVLNEEGDEMLKVVCDDRPGAENNNVGELIVEIPPHGEGFITETCTRGQVGTERDCGFEYMGAYDCTPGETVQVDVDPASIQTVVRICHKSAVIGTGIACEFLSDYRLANVVGTHAEFTCPAMLDGAGGGYSVYRGDVL